MTNAAEAAGAPTSLGSDLQAGVEAISANQTITFTRYVRVILPLDGFVFWVKDEIVSRAAVYNGLVYNGATYNQNQQVRTPAKTIVAKGSLHYATDTRQDEASTMAINRVVFTSEQEIQDLNEVDSDHIYIGAIDDVRFAFSTRNSFYRHAGLWHYVGNAVYPEMASQIVDYPGALDRRLVVSNSLPFWLALNGYAPFYGFGNSIPLYPSFLVPQNLAPVYGSVHIDPASTRAIQSIPRVGSTSSIEQLCADRVKITMFGARNDEALDFVACVLQRSADYDEFGIMNTPAVRDEKTTQSELNVIAQKKTVEFEVSYYQGRASAVGRQLIRSALATFTPTDAGQAA